MDPISITLTSLFLNKVNIFLDEIVAKLWLQQAQQLMITTYSPNLSAYGGTPYHPCREAGPDYNRGWR
jgi:hypothetical protein